MIWVKDAPSRACHGWRMFRATLILHTLLSSVVAGTAVTIALVAGVVSAGGLIAIAMLALLATWPVSQRIAKALFSGE